MSKSHKSLNAEPLGANPLENKQIRALQAQNIELQDKIHLLLRATELNRQREKTLSDRINELTAECARIKAIKTKSLKESTASHTATDDLIASYYATRKTKVSDVAARVVANPLALKIREQAERIACLEATVAQLRQQVQELSACAGHEAVEAMMKDNELIKWLDKQIAEKDATIRKSAKHVEFTEKVMADILATNRKQAAFISSYNLEPYSEDLTTKDITFAYKFLSQDSAEMDQYNKFIEQNKPAPKGSNVTTPILTVADVELLRCQLATHPVSERQRQLHDYLQTLDWGGVSVADVACALIEDITVLRKQLVDYQVRVTWLEFEHDCDSSDIGAGDRDDMLALIRMQTTVARAFAPAADAVPVDDTTRQLIDESRTRIENRLFREEISRLNKEIAARDATVDSLHVDIEALTKQVNIPPTLADLDRDNKKLAAKLAEYDKERKERTSAEMLLSAARANNVWYSQLRYMDDKVASGGRCYLCGRV